MEPNIEKLLAAQRSLRAALSLWKDESGKYQPFIHDARKQLAKVEKSIIVLELMGFYSGGNRHSFRAIEISPN